jgi:hypothetical protein
MEEQVLRQSHPISAVDAVTLFRPSRVPHYEADVEALRPKSNANIYADASRLAPRDFTAGQNQAISFFLPDTSIQSQFGFENAIPADEVNARTKRGTWTLALLTRIVVPAHLGSKPASQRGRQTCLALGGD